LGTLFISVSSIVSANPGSVVFIKTHYAPTSTFMDPTNTYDGYTPGTNIRYHLYLNVTTTGVSAAAITNLTMTDTLPAGENYVSGSQLSDPAAVSFSIIGQVLTWNWSSTVLNTVVNPPETPAGQRYEATVEYNATVSSSVPYNTYLTNTAVAKYNQVVPDLLSQPGASDTIWIANPLQPVPEAPLGTIPTMLALLAALGTAMRLKKSKPKIIP
jgi:uncharacterized repeat protein (TIGR01451 family)